ncbi:MAG TPA: ATP-binding protein [Acidobacteriaceae bacterium]|nr:ATP-binding protein [Acidobacteriaceae bacterium]
MAIGTARGTGHNRITQQPSAAERIFGSSEMAARIRAFDWRMTPVGAIEQWPDALVITVNTLLANQHAMLLFWGEDLTQFYNDAAIPILGADRHGHDLGRNARISWSEVWSQVGPQIDAAYAGTSCLNVDQLVPVLRDGQVQDAWFSYSYSPVTDAAGSVRGVLVNCLETTQSIVAERALRGERERLLAVFEYAPAFFAVLGGPEHVFQMTNPAYQRLIAGREVLGKPIRQALPEVVDQGYVSILDGVYRTGVPYIGHGERVMLAPGTAGPPEERRLDFLYQPLRDPGGAVSGVLVFGIDITERLRTEQQLRDERERSDFAASAGGIGYWFCDLPFDKLAWDARVKDHFWLPPDADVDIGLFYDRLHPDDRELTRQAIADSIANHTTYDIEYRTVSPASGEQKWIRAIGRTAYDPGGRPIRFDGVTLDVTALRAAEDARTRAEQALLRSEKLAVVGRLAATISHEINNPLEAVMNLLYLIQVTANDEQCRAYTRTAQDELNRVAHIVTHTLRFNRQTHSGALEPLTEMLDSAASIYEGRLRHSEIDLRREYSGSAGAVCLGAELRQVFANLIGNAFDASDFGGTILLRTHLQGHPRTGAAGVRVSVADRGCGMDAPTLRSLFEPFFTTKGDKGTGLGLWVSREILHKHGACVRVKSRPQPGPSGTVFSVWLPVPDPPRPLA